MLSTLLGGRAVSDEAESIEPPYGSVTTYYSIMEESLSEMEWMICKNLNPLCD